VAKKRGPKEFMRFAAAGPSFQRAWAILDKQMKLPCSWEVFLEGYTRAKGHRYLTPEAYAVQCVEESRHPERFRARRKPITTDDADF
jgi:hypothetical protein